VLKDGRVLFVRKLTSQFVANAHDATNEGKLVVKQQFLSRDVVDYVVTPNQSCAELTALLQLNFLMQHKHVAPVFCELKSFMAFYDMESSRHLLSTTMPRYEVDVYAWMDQTCPQKPSFTVSADPVAPWVYTQGAGRVLARSSHRGDVVLFNSTLRVVLLQVCLGLAQAQRYIGFTHNDLHAGNVMFDTRLVTKKRLLVTGVGSFVLPFASPGVRIIDFQHAAFDTYDSHWTRTGRMHGVKASVYNGFSMHYDAWRFCSNLVLTGLREVWHVVDRDLQQFLWAACQFPGPPGSAPPPLTAHQHWCPYMTRGASPEEMLQSPVFDVYRCDPATTCAQVITFECENDLARYDDDAYIRRRVLCSHDTICGLDRQSALNVFEVPLPPAELRTELCLALETALHTFTRHYAENAVSHAVLKHEHTKHTSTPSTRATRRLPSGAKSRRVYVAHHTRAGDRLTLIWCP
jgi:uncharacterized protein Usg